MKEVKFYCYYLEYKLGASLTNFTMEEYFKESLNLKDHLIPINEHKAFLEKRTLNNFSFQKFRKDFVPTIKDEQTGITRIVDLKDTESFIEEVFLFLYFKKNIIILSNH